MANFTFNDVDVLAGKSFLPREAITNQGDLWAWGNNGNEGLIGNGELNTSYSFPMQWPTTSSKRWVALAANNRVVHGITSDGRLWSWGSNGYYGNLGINLDGYYNYPNPTAVGSLRVWKKVFTSGSSSFAIKADGTLWAWGLNTTGQLGTGDRNIYSSPVQVGALTDWKSVFSAQGATFAIKTDGTLWAWGANGGFHGTGDLTNRSSPVQVGALTDWKQVTVVGASVFAIKTDSTLWAWGDNANGQLGLGDTVHRSSPVQVGAYNNWKQLSSTGKVNSIAAVKTDGTLWAWGDNAYGQLGLGDTVHRSSPVQVGALTDWSQVEITSSTIAIKTDGTLWAWGSNSSGQLGLGDTVHRSSPVQVGAYNNWNSVVQCNSGGRDATMFAITSSDQILL